MQKQTQSRSLAIGLTILSALGRLLPHAPNVTPVGGACLFAGARISGIWAYLLPLAVMLVTDPLVGGYTWGTPMIYAAFLINVWIGRRILRNATPARVGVAAFACSLQFFLLTNFAVWVTAVAQHSAMYPADLSGLIACYVSALPFWGRTLVGDLFYSGALFGLYELLTHRSTAPDAVTA